MKTTPIEGPLGGFRIPAEGARTQDHVDRLSRMTFDGEYDHPELPGNVMSILDIGAGWGAFAVWARRKWPLALQTAYEPHAAAADLYEHNAPFGKMRRRAVTIDPHPLLEVDWEWGSVGTSRKLGIEPGRQRPSVAVAAEHPADLPQVDLLKCDAEGVEAEVLESYRHTPTLRVLMYEFHSVPLRDRCRQLVRSRFADMRLLREEPDPATFGVAIWLRGAP